MASPIQITCQAAEGGWQFSTTVKYKKYEGHLTLSDLPETGAARKLLEVVPKFLYESFAKHTAELVGNKIMVTIPIIHTDDKIILSLESEGDDKVAARINELELKNKELMDKKPYRKYVHIYKIENFGITDAQLDRYETKYKPDWTKFLSEQINTSRADAFKKWKMDKNLEVEYYARVRNMSRWIPAESNINACITNGAENEIEFLGTKINRLRNTINHTNTASTTDRDKLAYLYTAKTAVESIFKIARDATYVPDYADIRACKSENDDVKLVPTFVDISKQVAINTKYISTNSCYWDPHIRDAINIRVAAAIDTFNSYNAANDWGYYSEGCWTTQIHKGHCPPNNALGPFSDPKWGQSWLVVTELTPLSPAERAEIEG